MFNCEFSVYFWGFNLVSRMVSLQLAVPVTLAVRLDRNIPQSVLTTERTRRSQKFIHSKVHCPGLARKPGTAQTSYSGRGLICKFLPLSVRV